MSGTSLPFDIIGFDLDGTLLHTGRELAASLNDALSRHGYSGLAADDAIAMIGGGARAMLARALAHVGETDEAAVERVFPDLIAHYSAHLDTDTDIYPGLLPLLDRLKDAGVRLAVVTNKDEGLSRTLIAAMGMADRFDLLIGGDTLGPDTKKPKPDMIEAMIERLGGGRALFVGDSEFDALAATAAGVPFVGMSFGYATQDLNVLGAAQVIDHYDALWGVMERLA